MVSNFVGLMMAAAVSRDVMRQSRTKFRLNSRCPEPRVCRERRVECFVMVETCPRMTVSDTSLSL